MVKFKPLGDWPLLRHYIDVAQATKISLVEVARVKQSVAVVEEDVEDHQEGHQLSHHPGNNDKIR